jgi:endonuclease-8
VPEGDTIHRTAARLRPALEGKTVASFTGARLVQSGPASGTVIDGVEAKGKYLLVHFGDGTTLETHMKMSGSWHLYRVGERWRRSASAARAVIETEEGWVAVCFSAPHVTLVASWSGPDHLGPDLCSPTPDLAAAVERFTLTDAATPLAVALLDQRICCGVGNVYKSEVMFACRLHPLTPVGAIDVTARRDLVTTAHTMLRQNLESGPRSTVVVDGKKGLAVYGRKGLPCVVCGDTVRRATHGEHARSTYWCDRCQQDPNDSGVISASPDQS